jgi:DNA-binding response OmpR family regulator
MMINKSDYHILIVDDLEKNLQVLGALLRDEGYRISFASNGEETLALLSDKIDMVLLDVMLPDIDGIEVCRRIRSNEQYKNLPVVFLTAKIDKDTVLKGLEAGGNDYITKPFNRQELLARVQTQIFWIDRLRLLSDENEELKRNQAKDVDKSRMSQKVLNELGLQMEQLEIAKSDFIDLVTRELKKPLSGVIGFADIVEETLTNEDQNTAVAYLQMSVARLKRLVDSAILLTELRSGERTPALKKFPVDDLINRSLYESQAVRNEKKVFINKRISPKKIEFIGDEELLVAALTKVVNNAVAASPRTKTINFVVFVEEGRLFIKVKDFGPGFSMKKLKQINEFIHGEKKGSLAMGPGLGMLLTKLVIDAHNGDLHIDNDYKGATVSISFPYQKGE